MPDTAACTVCRRITSDTTSIAGRQYCSEHTAALTSDFKPLWRASSAALVFLVLEVIILAALSLLVGEAIQQSTQAKIIIGIGVTIAPALVWMGLLYLLAGKQRPILSPLLPTVFVLGILTAAAATRPFLLEVLEYYQWLTRVNATNRFLGSILIGGFVHTFILYAVVRYTVWRTIAFDRRIVAILYALAASWGYGITFNLLEVFDRGGMAILNGGLREIAQLAAFLCTGLVIGYLLARSRFEDLPFFFLSAGMIGAAGFNGLLLYAITELNKTSLSLEQDAFSPWPGAIVGLLILIVTYAAVFGLLRRQNTLIAARLTLDHEHV